MLQSRQPGQGAAAPFIGPTIGTTGFLPFGAWARCRHLLAVPHRPGRQFAAAAACGRNDFSSDLALAAARVLVDFGSLAASGLAREAESLLTALTDWPAWRLCSRCSQDH